VRCYPTALSNLEEALEREVNLDQSLVRPLLAKGSSWKKGREGEGRGGGKEEIDADMKNEVKRCQECPAYLSAPACIE
jgi:hypothetical protein